MISAEEGGGGQLAIVIADEMNLRRAGLAGVLKEWAKTLQMVIVETTPRDESIELPSGVRCGLAVVNVGGQSCATGTLRHWFERIGSLLPEVPRVVFSDRETIEDAVAAFAAGVRGYVPTNIDPALAILILSFIMKGGSFFPPSALRSIQLGRETRGETRDPGSRSTATSEGRRRRVLELLREGRSNKLIARELGISESTVKLHVRKIMRRLGVTNRTQAALLASPGEGSASMAREGESDSPGALPQLHTACPPPSPHLRAS